MNYLVSKPILALTLGLTMSTAAFSQTSTTGIAGQANLNAIANLSGGANMGRGFDNRYEGVKGNPYFVDAFSPGKLEFKVGNTGKTEVVQDVKLKYDVFSNYLFVVSGQSKDTLQVSTIPIVSFTLDLPTAGGALTFKRFKEAQVLDPSLRDALFAVLYDSGDGKISLVKRVNKKKVDANYKGAYSAGQTYDEIFDETNYYVVANGSMQKVKLNKKSIVEALPNHGDKVKTFISSQKLAMSTEADLVKVASYYQSL